MQAKPAAPTTAAGVVAAAKQAAQPAPQSSPVPTATASSGDSAPAAFDMEAYISQYSGNTRIARLLNIADWFPNLKIDALRLAITELKQGFNTAAYAQACKMAGDALGPLGIFDAKWAEETDRKAQQQIDRLEIDLNGYKTNMVRESIRTCHNDMGDFYVRRGDYTNALKSYIRARDYSSSPKHEMALCFNVIKVSLAMGNYSYLQSFLTKAEAIPPEAGQPEPERRVLNSKLKVSNALHQLFSRNYRLAARALLECQVDIGAAFNEVITPADIALIGGLCALATYDRRDLKQKVIDNGPFKSFLELQPDLREAITRFYMCDYAECLGILDRIKARRTITRTARLARREGEGEGSGGLMRAADAHRDGGRFGSG
ncbi:putative COP9 signalosome complex subunit 1 [Paratrimastix pyriformis]|uniref:COP9 signalosome complex subunit 1 n=1 Tax=Paratrimastix pyriformis TaxID=342808 RepID=A0ABQ8UWF7_9EUKA|nr:putative COP9 signalosome complex subunit 1 [Paratrimastix pyriformis]